MLSLCGELSVQYKRRPNHNPYTPKFTTAWSLPPLPSTIIIDHNRYSVHV